MTVVPFPSPSQPTNSLSEAEIQQVGGFTYRLIAEGRASGFRRLTIGEDEKIVAVYGPAEDDERLLFSVGRADRWIVVLAKSGAPIAVGETVEDALERYDREGAEDERRVDWA